MKNVTFLFAALFIFCAAQFSSCSKSENTPVDRYVEIIEEATKQAEQIKSMDEMANIQSVISPEDAQELIKSSYDYQLTDSDKEKLKKATDKLIKVAFEKTVKFSNFSETDKKNAEMQIDLAIEAANKYIDNATTLGQISGMR